MVRIPRQSYESSRDGTFNRIVNSSDAIFHLYESLIMWDRHQAEVFKAALLASYEMGHVDGVADGHDQVEVQRLLNGEYPVGKS